MIISSLSNLMPELVLSVLAMLVLMIGTFYNRKQVVESILWFVSVSFFVLGIWILIYDPRTISAFNNAYVFDNFSRFMKVGILWSAAIILLIGKDYFARRGLLKFEYPVLIMLSVVGMMLMVSSNNFMALYMGLELQSLSLYVIAAFRRDSVRSTEAGLKYFVLGALSSGLFLYGVSLIYGFSGTTNFHVLSELVESKGVSIGLLFGLAFVMVSMAFKISAVPFHMWTPDVYEGSPTPVTAFFSTVPKIAAISIFIRVLIDGFETAINDWQQILIFLSVASMFIGAIAAIGQNNIKRLMAYSSISHMGFALIGLAAGTIEGLQSLLIYIVIYVLANIGVFSFILNMERDGTSITSISSLSLYSKVDSKRAVFISIIMLSLAGLPPFVGFIGKLYVFNAAVGAGLLWLALAGGLASVIGAFYYLRIVYLIYFGESEFGLNGSMPKLHWLVLTGSALAMIFGSINLFGLEDVVKMVATDLFS